MTTAQVLSIRGLRKSFDGFVAVQDVDFALAAGERHAVIGPNGAGKTTFFNLITGHLRPDAGEILLGDRAITGLPPHRIVRRGIARSFQRINIYPRLSVYESVQAAHIARAGRTFELFTLADRLYRDETEATLAAVGLTSDADAPAGTLAYGKQKQLELAIALAADPRLLLLDEPTAGMSPHETAEAIQLVGRIANERKLTLLFTEHDMDVVFSIADRVSVLHHGAIIATGTPDQIRRDAEVRRVYLGKAIDEAA
ncbi:MAG: ABC transporter ATP-binding protein [Burkholderiales bacterium]